MQYKWNIRCLSAVEQELQQQLERELSISSAAARMLVVRGIQTADEARQFIRPSMDKLHDPFLMKDMDKAVERLHKALTQGEKILIYGDYDVDGTTAVALMYRFLLPLTSNLSGVPENASILGCSSPLTYKIRSHFGFLALWSLFFGEVAHHPCHIACQGTHGLEAFSILLCFAFLPTMYAIPVLRRYNRHIVDSEVLIQSIKACAGSASSAYGHGSSWFVGEHHAGAVEQAVEQCAERAVWSCVIDGRTYH